MTNPAPGFNKHPGYQVEITPLPGQVVVRVGEQEIACSDRALAVTETRHHPVWYLPFADVDQTLLSPTATSTYCPFKGHASYWSVVLPEQTVEDALWAYCSPYDECLALKDHVSFYTNRVDLFIDGQPANKDGPGWV